MPVIESIDAMKDELIAIRRDLHQYPELGFEEVRTSGMIAAKLAGWGIEVHTGIGRTGVVGIVKGTCEGRRMIGLRADMDALPMEEGTGLPYASRNPGRFHGCGHDSHVAMLLGAARYLSQTRAFSGTVALIFQPAEEGLGGARAMIADGLFERFPCDEIYGLHNSPSGLPGRVSIKPGTAMAGADFFDIRVHGKGGHAAKPETAIDPILIATSLVQTLQSVVSRNLDPLKAAVLSVTRIHAGAAYNVIPEECTLAGTLRFLDRDVAEMLRTRMRAIVAGAAVSFGVEIGIDFRNVFDVLVNTEDLVEGYAAAARDIVGPANVVMRSDPVMGSEDFADMLKVRPGVYCQLGHAGTVSVHNPGFLLDESIIPVGASLYARIAERRLAA